MAEFQSEFEQLMNRVTGISEDLLISLFVGGLKSTLKRDLMNKPRSLTEAFELAREHEDRLEELMMENKASYKWSNRTAVPNMSNQPYTIGTSSNPNSNNSGRELLPTPTQTKT